MYPFLKEMKLTFSDHPTMSHISKFTAKTIIAALCVAVFVSSGIIINADNDDEYIQFNDYETAQAYRFWSLYGLTPDTSTSYTQTYSTSGTFTSSANVYLSGTSSTGGSLNTDNIRLSLLEDFKSDETGQLSSIDVAELLNTLSIKVAAEHDDRRDQMSLHFGACTAFSNNASGDQVTYNITCDGSTDNYYYNNTTYDITIDDWSSSDPHTVMQWSITPKTDVYMDGNIPYSAYSHENGDFSGVAQINLSESISESGSISTNGALTFTTTTVNTNSLKYVYPLAYGTVNNDNNSFKHFIIRRNNPFVIVALISSGTPSINSLHYFIRDNQNVFNEVDDLRFDYTSDIRGGYRLFRIELYNQNYINTYCRIELDNIWNNIKLIPLYANYKNNMSDGLYRFIYGTDRLIETIVNQESQTRDLIDNGNPDSQAANTELLSQSGEFGETSDALFTFEDAQIDDMNDRLNNARTPSNKDLLRSNKFIASANWVTTQFMRLVSDTPLELVLYFCLTMGLAIVFIKKVE